MNDDAWRRWRDQKLAWADAARDQPVVEIADPDDPSAGELQALLEGCARTNMAVYRWRAGAPQARERSRLRALAAHAGLLRLDRNWLAGDDGISSLQVEGAAPQVDETLRVATTGGTPGVAPARTPRVDYIPYTDRPIRWHTDGYYHPPQRRIRAMMLHCCERADVGGVNRLLDHELVYILLRERDPALLAALCHPDAMTIPARASEDGSGTARAEQAGPVFSGVPGTQTLHMRYTARTRSIAWRDDVQTRAAVQALADLLDAPPRWTRTLRLEPGMGVICNNVLHDRSGFVNAGARQRLVLRARFVDRVAAPELEAREWKRN